MEEPVLLFRNGGELQADFTAVFSIDFPLRILSRSSHHSSFSLPTTLFLSLD